MKQKRLNRIMTALIMPLSPVAFIGAALDTVAVTVGAVIAAMMLVLIWAALTPAPRGRYYDK